MRNSQNLKIILELFETVEHIKSYIGSNDRQIAVMHFNSLEKRILTIQSIYSNTHIVNKILDKIYSLHVGELYHELEADLERYEKKGFILTARENNE